MTRRRWIADQCSADRAWLTGEHARHLVRVLRAEAGQEFDIVTAGRLRRGTIIGVNEERVEFELGEEVAFAVAPSVTLFLAIYKFDRMEWAIEKCTELGVERFVPVIARRTDAHLASAAVKRVERWRRIARQAAEQSRRTSVPEVEDPAGLKDILGAGDVRIVLSESERQLLLRDAIRRSAPGEAEAGYGSRMVTLALGPEGGWAEDELQEFANAGWVSATLGPTILRAETAAIAATVVVLSELAL